MVNLLKRIGTKKYTYFGECTIYFGQTPRRNMQVHTTNEFKHKRDALATIHKMVSQYINNTSQYAYHSWKLIKRDTSSKEEKIVQDFFGRDTTKTLGMNIKVT